MTNYLAKFGVKAVRNGWPIVLLPFSSKKPIGNGWQNREVSLTEVKHAIAAGKKYGFGIRCGNVVGIDDDYESSEVVTDEFLDAVEELKNHYFPKTLWRRGRDTREPLRVFRLEGEAVARSMNIDKLQIIGKGRQFVAYNRHPDTQQDYKWLMGEKRGVGSPASLKYDDVPEYSTETLDEFLRSMLLLEETFGLAPDRTQGLLKSIKSGERVKSDVPLWAEQGLVEKACEFIVNDPKWGWEDWNNNIMMPLWNASKGEEWGRALAHKLSEQHDLYNEEATDERWDGITKSPPDQLGWARLNWLARQGGMPFQGPMAWSSIRMFRDGSGIIDSASGLSWDEKMFNDQFARFKDKGISVRATFMESRPEQVYDRKTWDPGQPEGLMYKDNFKYWNLWKEPDWYGEKGNIKPWLDIMERVYGPEVELVIKRMALDIQYPAARPTWHILIIGSHGIGKNTSMIPLAEWALKFNLYSAVNWDSLNSSFNSYLNKKKIIMANDVTSVHNKIFNKLKDFLANTVSEVEINEKYLRPYRVENVGSWYFSTNAEDPISISRNERRLLVCKSQAMSPTAPDEQEIAVAEYAWMKENYGAVVWHLKHEVKVDREFGDRLPKRTRAQMDLAEMTAPLYEVVADNLKTIINGDPLITIAEIQYRLENSGLGIDFGRLNPKIITKALHHVAAHSLGQIEFPGRVQRRFWTTDPLCVGKPDWFLRGMWDVFGRESVSPEGHKNGVYSAFDREDEGASEK